MLNFIKNIFSSGPAIGSTGVNLNTEDVRDIELVSFTPARSPLSKFITDISAMPVEDQVDKPDCVGQAEGLVVQYYFYKATGVLVRICRRFIYAMCKTLDGDLAPGTQSRIGAMVVTKYYGAATTETVPDDTSLSYADFINVKLTGAVLDDAAKHKLPGFAFVNANENEICQAIEDHGIVTITLAVDPNSWFRALLQKVFRIAEYHRVDIYGNEIVNGKRKIYFRNHWNERWGNQGNGEFWLADYINYMYDLIVYTAIPADLLEKARTTNFQFDSAVAINYGDKGYVVYKLQQRLQAAGYLKNVDIASIEPYFGNMTAAALLSYQIDNHIDSVKSLQALGGKSCGPKTIDFLNSQYGATPRKNMIVAWAQAAQSFEGWTPGSRSYVNNNPGNLRSWPTQVGTRGGFAVFASYAAGFQALCDLFTNAATGKSLIYHPDMTLVQFYETYAPSSDNNSPSVYANFVAAKMGITSGAKIRSLV